VAFDDGPLLADCVAVVFVDVRAQCSWCHAAPLCHCCPVPPENQKSRIIEWALAGASRGHFTVFGDVCRSQVAFDDGPLLADCVAVISVYVRVQCSWSNAAPLCHCCPVPPENQKSRKIEWALAGASRGHFTVFGDVCRSQVAFDDGPLLTDCVAVISVVVRAQCSWCNAAPMRHCCPVPPENQKSRKIEWNLAGASRGHFTVFGGVCSSPMACHGL
jgi:predicted aspartyl protease